MLILVAISTGARSMWSQFLLSAPGHCSSTLGQLQLASLAFNEFPRGSQIYLHLTENRCNHDPISPASPSLLYPEATRDDITLAAVARTWLVIFALIDSIRSRAVFRRAPSPTRLFRRGFWAFSPGSRWGLFRETRQHWTHSLPHSVPRYPCFDLKSPILSSPCASSCLIYLHAGTVLLAYT